MKEGRSELLPLSSVLGEKRRHNGVLSSLSVGGGIRELLPEIGN